MKTVFVAVGGTGTKVAAALVRMLSIGFPLPDASEGVEIWKLDLDGHAGAALDLQRALSEWRDARDAFGSSWSPALLGPKAINPLEGVSGRKEVCGFVEGAEPLLSAFYSASDQSKDISYGLFARPNIGVLPMAQLAESKAMGKLLDNIGSHVRFVICGSLHGGTGAAGVPVLGSILRAKAAEKAGRDWNIEALILTPYELARSVKPSDLRLDGVLPPGSSPEEVAKFTADIRDGYFSDPATAVERAQAGFAVLLEEYREAFNRIYLVGKPQADSLPRFANQGDRQRNPANAAEVVAALAALHAIATVEEGLGKVMLPTAEEDLSGGLALRDLPMYGHAGQDVVAEKVVLSLALLRLFLVPKGVTGPGFGAAGDYTWLLKGRHPEEVRSQLRRGFTAVGASLRALLDTEATPETSVPPAMGWEGNPWKELEPIIHADDDRPDALQNAIAYCEDRQKRMFRASPRGHAIRTLPFGLALSKVSAMSLCRPTWSSGQENDLAAGLRRAQAFIAADLGTA